MAIAKMRRVRMVAHKSISNGLLDKIQKLGCCQFISQNRDKVRESDAEWLRARLRRVDDLLGETRFVLRFLEPYAANKGGGLAKALGDLPSHSISGLAALASEDRFMEASKRVRALEKRSSETRAGISRLTGIVALLSPLAELPYSLDFYTAGTSGVIGSMYSVPTGDVALFRSAFDREFGEMGDFFALPAGAGETSSIVSVIIPRSGADALQSILSGVQSSRVEIPATAVGLASVELSRLAKELDGLKSEDAAITEEIKSSADDAWKLSEYCADFWNIEKAKLEAMIAGEQTEQILLTSFWIPERNLPELRRETEPYEGMIDIEVTEPAEGDNPPVMLRNGKFSNALEPLITMFGTPSYGGFDPTAVVTPFFYLFFGMCFGDAGYGLVLSALLIFLIRTRNITGALRKFLVVLTVGNIMAVVVGAITFSWFGDSLTSFSFLKPLSALRSLQILDPMNDPMTYLGISLTLGFIQIMTGLVIALAENLKRGDRLAAFADQGGWIIFLCGLVLLGLSSSGALGVSTRACGVVAGAGALILVATQGRGKSSVVGKFFSGVMSLYNVTGYLGDVLSYSRLLALGLGSAAVGMVINLLANLVSGVPYIGVLLGLLIFVLGHVFSIAVNVLGAFVHSLRLQYVEFFGKFYEASGEDFAPLSMSTQYVKLSD
jgi:V/A-type H+-transporting ATPase subunit I